MSKHTPGPWIARKVNGAGWSGQCGFAIDFNEDQEQVVDFVYEEADARLIAAAPDLLEALELHDEIGRLGILKAGSLLREADAKRKAALAKARGEP